MKQANSIFLGVLMCASACAFISCGNKTQPGGNADSDSISINGDTITVESQVDSMVNENVNVSVEMSLPTGDGVAQKIRETLVNLMGKQIYKDADFLGDGSMKGAAFTGNANDMKAMCTFYCKNIYKEVSKEFNDDAADAAEYDDNRYTGPDHYVYYQNMNLVKVCEKANYIIFNDQAFGFRGGCHEGGITNNNFIIFNRTTGEQVKNILKPGSENKMQGLLLDGFKAYFKKMSADDPDDFQVNSDDDVKNLIGVQDTNIPLPNGSTIKLTDNGLEVSYAQEEISCYALGQPTFTIPYDKAKPFMTAEALELLK